MPDLTRPRRDGVLDNLWGVIACLVLAILIYVPNSGYPASCATRAGVTVYLWFCLLPAMIIGLLTLLAVLLPGLRLIYGWLGLENRMGLATVSLGAAIGSVMLVAPFIPEAIPQAFLAGVFAGLVFTITRDFAGALIARD
ncbi:MAG: hypothetical protein AAFN43_04870 [Pseudomonadota bacterium]